MAGEKGSTREPSEGSEVSAEDGEIPKCEASKIARRVSARQFKRKL